MSILVRKSISRMVHGVDYEMWRTLPTKGIIHAEVGQTVSHNDIVGTCEIPGEFLVFKLASILGVSKRSIARYLLKKKGEEFEADEVIAQKGFLTQKRYFHAPVRGVLVDVDTKKGEISIQREPAKFDLQAGFEGVIKEVVPAKAVVVEIIADVIQGSFGVVRECVAPIEILSDDEPIKERHIDGGSCDKVIVSSGSITIGVIRRALSMGVRGIIAAGIPAEDWKQYIEVDATKDFLETGKQSLSLLFVEGFGDLQMQPEIYEYLKRIRGKSVLIETRSNDRPRVVLASEQHNILQQMSLNKELTKLKKGQCIRVVSGVFFGTIATVSSGKIYNDSDLFGPQMQMIKIKLDNGEEAFIPRWNFEVL